MPLTRLADENLAESFRAHARWQAPCEWHEAEGLLRIAGANRFPGPYKNTVFRVDPGLSPSQVLERADSHFAPLGRKYSVGLRDSRDGDLKAHLEHTGHAEVGQSPCMVVDRPVPVPPLPDAVSVHAFDALAEVDAAVEISVEAYESLGLPPAEARQMLARVGSGPEGGAWLGEGVRGVLLRQSGVPVATAMVLEGAGHAGIYWVGVRPQARGQGMAALCTALAAQVAFERGAKVVTLQSSPMGLPVYQKLGFRTIDVFRRYRMA